MLINVPQYIDVEDKVAGPLTAKQLLWMIGLGIIMLILWNVVPKPVFFIMGLPLALLFVGLAFYKPYGQPLGSFIVFGIMYFFRPKVYVWKRTFQHDIQIPKAAPKQVAKQADKHIDLETLHSMAQMLDSEGAQHTQNIDEFLKQRNSSSVRK
ncbi:MAG TPA: PrgI family protein [Patescibacteria group bacterium]